MSDRLSHPRRRQDDGDLTIRVSRFWASVVSGTLVLLSIAIFSSMVETRDLARSNAAQIAQLNESIAKRPTMDVLEQTHLRIYDRINAIEGRVSDMRDRMRRWDRDRDATSLGPWDHYSDEYLLVLRALDARGGA